VALVVVALLSVLLLILAPRGGIWMGLGLQVIVGAHAVAFTFLIPVIGVLELVLGVISALSLAMAAGQRSRP